MEDFLETEVIRVSSSQNIILTLISKIINRIYFTPPPPYRAVLGMIGSFYYIHINRQYYIFFLLMWP